MLALFKRIIAASLAACMMLAALTSCGNKKTDGAQTTSTAATSEAVSGVTSETTSQQDTTATSSTTSTSTASKQAVSTPTTTTQNQPGGTQTGTGSTDGASDGSKALKIWWYAGDESMDAAVRYYEREHKDINITLVTPPDYTVEALKRNISAGTEPNIVMLDHVYITSLGKSGQILDLNQFGAKSLASKYITSCWNGVSFNGKTYGLPHNGNTIALMYNKDMLDAANQKAPKTYNELINVGKKVKTYLDQNKDKGEYAYTSPFFDTASQGRKNWSAFVYFFWLWRNGGEILNAKNTKAVFNSAAGVNALSQLKGLVTEGICAPSSYLESNFYNGTIGMIEMGNWALDSLTAADRNAEFNVTMLPKLKSGVPGYSGLGLYALGITSKTKYKTEAYDFIKYFTTNDELQLQYGKQHDQLPVTKSAIKSSQYSKGFWQLYIKQFALSKSRPGVNNWDQIEALVADAVNSVISGTSKAKDALDNAANRVDAILKKG